MIEQEKQKHEKHELSQEIIEEWRKEKEPHISEKEDKERIVTATEEEVPSLQPSFAAKKEEEKKEEDAKKLTIKKDIKQLLAIAEKKGLVHSIKEAQKKNDPFLLDVYHDVLAKDAAYKKILNQKK